MTANMTISDSNIHVSTEREKYKQCSSGIRYFTCLLNEILIKIYS